MKKYRLIKKYPGSPTLNTIITIESSQETGYYSENKEFWEEVVEKDYEILSFKNELTGMIWKSDSQLKNTFCLVDGQAPFMNLKTMLSAANICINSVLRKSDNCVFIIGDDVKLKNNSLSFKINKFDINVHDNSKLLISSFENTFIFNLNAIEKFKPVLFTTEDGVDIYEGDRIHQVNKDFEYYSYYWGIQHGNKGVPFENFKIFSTKEKAEEFIILNKPCLSINDVNNCYNYAPHGSIIHNKLVENLKELVKSKL